VDTRKEGAVSMDVCGFLYSQKRYDLKDPKRALVRSANPEYIPDGIEFEMIDLVSDETAYRGIVNSYSKMF
jgi:hypothetical protein